ncbi:FAD-dependent oxidoreductase [Pedobacter glucosidilyticus]|uniref:FAD-dependent oxidoreductase n=1 Tax=Pedobacter glucosidilyticus TaxID=1122941 RepID=UPI001FDEBC5C|nr:FAD-dependent oxidoreductase [Pedobacter glucosidilyticus]
MLKKTIQADLLVVGGGLSGVCAAITAARVGVKVVLVQDRPVLGGNSSSEVRLWILGATSHLGNNNRWSREGGVIDEILVENTYKNKEGNPLIFDTILLDKVVSEPNIQLFLNTVVYDLDKSSPQEISSVKAFCSQNSTEYEFKANYYCDASGDGIIGFLSGAAFRMGAESMEEFGEKFAPAKEYGELLGHSIYFYSKDVGKPVKFSPPEFALTDITKIPRFRNFSSKDYGCRLWWLEYGGRLDTVHDTEEIKWELWKVVYGVWNYIKNSGNFPDAENLTLEWVGAIPGKRESRRFEGDYIIKQQDVVEQRTHFDAVAYGGWSIDLHPADGVFSEKPGCNQWHAKGVYQIPFRSLYSKNISNLFLAGRIISATHVAFASTRVMATGAHIGQAIGMAAKIALKHKVSPKEILEKNHLEELQQELLKTGHHIPGVLHQAQDDLVQSSQIAVSSTLSLDSLSADILKSMDWSMAQMVPLKVGRIPSMYLQVYAMADTHLEVELRLSTKLGNFTPDDILQSKTIAVKAGQQEVLIDFDETITQEQYAFIVFKKNPELKIYFSEKRITGVLSVFNAVNKAVSNFGKQTPSEDIGVDEFEFWCPQRRPEGHNLALRFDPSITAFDKENIKTGIYRPSVQPNAWVASLTDEKPSITITWEKPEAIKQIDLFFDTDFDHPMESVLMGHPEDVMPFCVRNYIIKDDKGLVVFEKKDNYQTVNTIRFEEVLQTSSLHIILQHPSPQVPASLFGVRCYKA